LTRYCDAHIHLSHSKEPVFEPGEQYFCVTSCHSKEEFEGASLTTFGSGFPGFRYRSIANATAYAAPTIPCAFASYGIHPQSPSLRDKTFIEDELAFLEKLLATKKIIAIGECGFDFFTPEFKSTAAEQETVFNEQLFLAQKYNVPLVLHLRKSIEKIFTYSKELKKIPAVIFHSFPGTLREAQSLQNHGINAFFSFGKPILNGKKASIDCVQNLPLQNLLFETDAPYQTLKGESETFPTDIKKVYQKASELRGIRLEELSEAVYENFQRSFANSSTMLYT